jgi:hypothetical protein
MMLRCVEFHDGDGDQMQKHFRWSAYLQHDCETALHKTHQAIYIVWLIAVTFLGQFLMWLRIWFNRFELDNVEVRLRFGFVYNDYKVQYYYWEFVKTFVKIVLICLTIVELDMRFRILLLASIFTMYYQLIKRVRPYQEEPLNEIDQQITVTFIATSILLLGLQSSIHNPYESAIAGGALCVAAAINILVVGKMGMILLCEYFEYARLWVRTKTTSQRVNDVLVDLGDWLEQRNPMKFIAKKARIKSRQAELMRVTMSKKKTGLQEPLLLSEGDLQSDNNAEADTKKGASNEPNPK